MEFRPSLELDRCYYLELKKSSIVKKEGVKEDR